MILIKGERFNATHRKFAILVTNSGRFLVVFGLILAQKEQYLIVGSAAISLVLLVATIKYLIDLSGHTPPKKTPAKASGEAARQRSPPREAKRD